ncbi:MAG TPA: hypothetical protein VGF94_12040 [Kofleriaceae bacterium]
MRRVAMVAAGVVALWLVALVVLDAVLAAREARHVRDRAAEALHATASVGAADLALVRGGLELDQVAAHRDDAVGHLALEVGALTCDLPPLGAALVDGTCRELAVSRVRLEVSTAAMFQLEHPRRAPLHAERVVIDDAKLSFGPSAFVSGLGSISVAIDHAEAGSTVFRTPLSWVFALDTMVAHVELPGHFTFSFDYHDGSITVVGFGGHVLGTAPVVLPNAALARDGHEEMVLLADAAEEIAARIVEQSVTDWVRERLR